MVKYLHKLKSALLLLTFLFVFTNCDDDEAENTTPTVTKAVVIENYADLVYANYVDTYNLAATLKQKIETFLANPTAETLADAKQAWLDSREPYGQTEAFRFYDGPIDDEDGPEGQLNAWPLDESYIDYVSGNVNGADGNINVNIIGDAETFPTIDKDLIAAQNEDGGETNISSGYHAIEFLLWGQDLSEGAGGGDRPYTDYVTTEECTNGNCDRRGDYLLAASELLLDDLQVLLDAWQPGADYRSTFTSESELDNSLEKILIGIGKLSKGELAGERMFVAWDEKSKEDEHSCFSDNTHRDIVNNAKGIFNVYTGTYVWTDGTVMDGPGINDLVEEEDETLNTEMLQLLNSSFTATQAIQAPFDQEFLAEPGRTRIKNAIDLLREQGDKIAEISAMFGFTLDPSDV
ncbi:imelysin family protein [Chondrinema litorale]|uniref:imelysin family protein n=1 Tax=Chondrinema litorale TaxID=2994555 RepID=UPI0025434472|nr:imelysin family protein [Chondrinema litorale]UZR96933.1 peptidase m75, imelysin [Chondrinema litorale]